MLRLCTLVAPAALLVLTASVHAGDDPIPIGSGSCDHTFARAGHPEVTSILAKPSNTGQYAGYYVGGGCVLSSVGPGPGEGTWGWDFLGSPWLPHNVILGWCQRGREQGGIGAYKTDGPRVPDPLGIKLPPRENRD